MEPDGKASDGAERWKYVFSGAYQGYQDLFEQSQATMDPNNIATLLHEYPYHVDALLAMHELYRCALLSPCGCMFVRTQHMRMLMNLKRCVVSSQIGSQLDAALAMHVLCRCALLTPYGLSACLVKLHLAAAPTCLRASAEPQGSTPAAMRCWSAACTRWTLPSTRASFLENRACPMALSATGPCLPLCSSRCRWAGRDVLGRLCPTSYALQTSQDVSHPWLFDQYRLRVCRLNARAQDYVHFFLSVGGLALAQCPAEVLGWRVMTVLSIPGCE